MKLTLKWLKQYVDFSWSPEELAERLTMLGIEVEGMQSIGGEFAGVVVAQVLTSEKHPNADKLSVCRVADGQGERQIVCGAKNYTVGDKVPLVLPGASLPAGPDAEPYVIKVTKMRGVESHGMLCSPKELGLADDAEGLMILPAEAKVGQAFADFLGRAAGDVVYDLEITPNRPDLNSVIGVAREISALTGHPLQLPAVPCLAEPGPDGTPVAGGEIDRWVAVRLENDDLCPRYTARVIRGVKIGPSPDWLRHTLEKVGVRSISNVVDVTNYVMLETGQPLHAFDYHLLAAADGKPPTIVVRPARPDEKFITLVGQVHTQSGAMLLIADETKAVALAGIMGGQNSEINERTVDVLLESAYFKPQNIRATSKQLDLRTESSYRFERGADLENTDWASRRATQLILETAAGGLVSGVVDAFPKPRPRHEITLRFQKTDDLLGISVPPPEQLQFLSRLGLEIVGQNDPLSCRVRVPPFRVDLKREVDLIEEIARLYGVERIPATPPRGAIGAHPFDTTHDQLAEARRLLAGLGLNEAQGQTLLSEKAAGLAGPDAQSAAPALENALSSDMNLLRPSLLPGLLQALSHNLHHKNPDVALFEIGRVFTQAQGQFQEQRRLGIALTGLRHPPSWSSEPRGSRYDLYDLKGILEEFFDHYGVRGLTYERQASASALWAESARVHLGKQNLGETGLLLPPLARQHDLRDPVLLAELDLELILARRISTKAFKSLPLFPSVRRDVAMLVPEQTPHDTILNTIKRAKPAFLEAVELFDVYRGQNVPAGQKSLAYAFTYRHPERTLKDSEVNDTHAQVVASLRQIPHASIRD